MILGIGVDVVDVEGLAGQLDEPGTSFAEAFTARERRRCGGDPARLAARWAAKEAFVKAWSTAISPAAPVLPEVVWHLIEVVHDPWGRPALELHGDVARAVGETLGEVTIHVSMSHDGPVAMAEVIVERA